MVIMQSASAVPRREYLQSHNLAKVIFEHRTEESVCIQYHPKGIKGGVMPELDSHFPVEDRDGNVPDGMKERFAPWHACGPVTGWEKRYGEAMKQHSHLHLVAITLQLAPGDDDVEAARTQWEALFGVEKLKIPRRKRESAFINATMAFCEGREGEHGGLREVVIGVEGAEKFQGALKRARDEGLEVEEDRGSSGTFGMLGVRWKIILLDQCMVKSRL
jgi:hypothetical protein